MLLLTLMLACPAPTDTAPADTGAGDTDVGPDRDGDGVPDDADCLPDNANAYPGHYEVPYNGVDDDCNGSDITDVDGDGVDGEGAGGTDCDDSNPEISPTEVEHCYDGLDNNCDGWEGGNDCDGDGYEQSHDCWDDEELAYPNGGGLLPKDVHPDTTDVWYDGTDADCGGNDDYDQDADGAASVDYAGSDCVDTDPNINPDMDEVWNDVDDDCDGTLDTMVPGQASMRVTGDTGRGEADFAAPLVFLPDLDGDGRDDLAVGAPASSDYYGWLWILPTGDGILTPTIENLGSLTGVGGTGAGLALTEVTGTARLAVGNPWVEASGIVEFYDTENVADGQAIASISQSFGGGALASLADGRLYVACTYGATTLAASTWSVVSGNLAMSDAPFSVYSEDYACVDAGNFGDLDADGLDDVFMSGSDSGGKIQLFLATGAVSGAGGAVTPDELEHLGAYAQGELFGTLPDITGDGYDEALFTNPTADGLTTEDGRTWIVNGAQFTGAWTTDAFVTLSGGTYGAWLRPGNLGDVDHDGTMDLMVGLPGLGTATFVPVPDLLAGGDVVPAVFEPSFYDSAVVDLFGDAAWAHDVDHDGMDDVLVRSDRNAGSLHLFLHQ